MRNLDEHPAVLTGTQRHQKTASPTGLKGHPKHPHNINTRHGVKWRKDTIMLNYTINRVSEDDSYTTFTVSVPKDTSNGRGHVTRSTNDLVVASYTRFEVEMNGGVPSIVERTANYTVEKNITDEEVAANLRKMFGDAVRINSIERYNGTIVGIPVEVFQALGRPIERPESQRK